MAHQSLLFRGAGEATLAYVEHAWSVDYSGNATIKNTNHRILDGIANLMKQYPTLHMGVHVEAGSAEWAASTLAEHYKLRRRDDVQLLMDHLARHRADACVAQLIKRGIEPERLYPSFMGSRSGRRLVDFRPMAPRKSKLGDPRSGLEHIKEHFIVSSQPQDVTLSLYKATGDIKMLFKSQHETDPMHWSHFLTVPTGMKLAVKHTGLKKVISEGVVTTDDNTCTSSARPLLHSYTV